MPRSTKEIERYYDFLYLWPQLHNRFRAFASNEGHMIHRRLRDEETGEYTDHTIHRLIAKLLAGHGPVDALDAGCGYGGTCIELGRAIGGRWHGITINKRQARIATRCARELGLSPSVSFAQASYDTPLSRSFNVIYGIESLVHSASPHGTVANLAASLRQGGLFIIVDDMLVEPVAPEHAEDVATTKAFWRFPVMPSAQQWSAYLEQSGCRIEEVRDLAGLMWRRTDAEWQAELDVVQRRRRWLDRVGLRMVGEAQLGGLLLERLNRRGASRYTMIVARKT